MINDEKRYEFITSMQRYHNEKIIEAFNLFIKLTTAIIVGVIYIELSNLASEKHDSFALAAYIAEGAVCLVCLTTMISNLLAWWDFRNAESDLVGKKEDKSYKITKPTFPRSCYTEMIMIGVVILTFLIFIFVIPI